jgi:hypothetical protein
MTKLAAEIARIKAKVTHATEDSAIRFDRVAASLQFMHDSAARQLDELRSASDEAWESVRTGVEATWMGIKSSFKNRGGRRAKPEGKVRS